MTNSEYPCYHAVFEGAAGRGDGLDGFMIAYRFKGRTGHYSVQTTGPEFDQMVQLARQADFFNLQVPDERARPGSLATVLVDGPRDQVMIRRCNDYTAIESFGDMNSEQYKRLIDLADQLTSIIDALPWQKKNHNDDWKDVERYFLP